MEKKYKILILIGAIALPLGLGFLSSSFIGDAQGFFNTLAKPPLSPPGWLFPIVWTILYTLMGISSYLIYVDNNGSKDIKIPLGVYGVQLLINISWSYIFFNLGAFTAAFIVLLTMWILITIMIVMFKKINKVAAYLQIPYLIWVTFAGYLNCSVALLN